MSALERDEKPDFMHYLAANMKCVTCGQRYRPEDIRVLGHRDEFWIMAVSCRNCETQGIVFAMVREGEAPAAEVLSELTREEWKKFGSMPHIGMDDVLDIHGLLRDFQGDMYELLDGRASPD